VPIRRTTGTRLGGVTRPLSVQVSYQAGACGDTENKRSISGCTYQFCFKVRKDLRPKTQVSAAAGLRPDKPTL
jgi:hypothetical protein